VIDEELRTSLRQIRDFGAALYKLGTGIVAQPQIARDETNNESQAFMEVIANASCDGYFLTSPLAHNVLP
jgi:hypothetical protein